MEKVYIGTVAFTAQEGVMCMLVCSKYESLDGLATVQHENRRTILPRAPAPACAHLRHRLGWAAHRTELRRKALARYIAKIAYRGNNGAVLLADTMTPVERPQGYCNYSAQHHTVREG